MIKQGKLALTARQICMESKMGWEMVHVREEILPNVFDLSEACCPLYTWARCSKLLATLILMNICTTHGCSNECLDELSSLLHKFILPIDNCLPPTMYHAKSLTQKLGMECNIIHACKMGCILCRGVYVDLQECPKCGSPRYKQVGHT